jgi:hypothetical protein
VSAERWIGILLTEAARPAECKEARGAWVRATAAAWRKAQRAMDERCEAAAGRLSEDEFERLCDEEEAKIAAFRAPLLAVVERDLWPKELYVGGV